jgi:glutamyl-Q tRNA(Asp) synthetase
VPDTGPPYRGRFAPSPTGPLHLGSLIAALASYLDARLHAGTWLVRMEDLDPPREEMGAAQGILKSLQNHGLQWDEEVLLQSQRDPAYAAALLQLQTGGNLFACDCTRQLLGPDGACRGSCRQDQGQFTGPTATRVTVLPDCHINFTDQIQGLRECALGTEVPDFIVKRKDGLTAYQLAVVVDDAWQGITHIVRGSDLLHSTQRQIFLQQLLGYPTPQYSHIPVISDAGGQKLSKQNHARPLDDHDAPANLRAALKFLGQSEPPVALDTARGILDFAIARWSPARIPALLSIPASGGA